MHSFHNNQLKFKHFVIFCTLFLFLGHISGQNINYAKEVVQKLASPHFKGRGYVGNGNKFAAKYIKKEYRKIGIKPFTNDFYQNFNIKVNTFPSKMDYRVAYAP